MKISEVRFFSFILLIILLAQCNDSEEEIDPTNPNPNPPVNLKYDGFDFTIQSGDYWEFYWLKESEFGAGNNISASSETGNFRVTVGNTTVIEGITAYELNITGENLEEYGGPPWRYLAIQDNLIMGSTTGDSLETIFDAQNGTWKGGGFFNAFDKSSGIDTRTVTIDNEYIYTENAIRAGYQDGQSFCEIIGGVQVCSNDDSFTLRVADYYKEGIGPIGYELYYSVFDIGGGVSTLSKITFEIGLVSSSLTANDGFIPTYPPWLKKTSMPRFVQEAASFIWDQKIYLFGGRNEVYQPISTSLIYDPVADVWSEGPVMPYNVFKKGYVVNDRVYFTDSDRDEGLIVYDPNEDTWELGSVYPDILQNNEFYSAVLGEFIFFFPIRQVIPADVLAYSPIQDAWFTGSSSRWTFDELASISTVGNRIILTGGLKSGDFLTTVHIYDPTLEFGSPNAWNKISGVLDEGRAGHRSEALDNILYIMGGDNYGPVIRAVETYDPETGGTKVISSMIDAREYFMSAVLNGKIYVMGGFDGDPLLSVEEYSPDRDRRNQQEG